MQLNTKKCFDEYLGTPLLAIVALLSRGCAWLGINSRRRGRAFRDGDSILIIKFQGLGSLVMAKPALHAFKARYPRSKIYFWGTRSTTLLADLMPEIERTITLDDRSLWSALKSVISNLITVWRSRVSWAFDLEVYSRLSSLLTNLTMIPNRAGFAISDLGSLRYSHTHLVLFNRYKWIGFAYLRLINLVDHANSDAEVSEFGAWRRPSSPVVSDTRYVVVNIHTGDLAQERRWPTQNFDQLIRMILSGNADVKIYLTGHGVREINETRALAESMANDRVSSLAGDLGLAETIELLRRADLVITADSGPMHLAVSTGTRLVALFGPTNAAAYLLPKTNVRAVSLNLYCSPCIHHWPRTPCNGNNICMQRMTLTQVFAAVRDLCPDITAGDATENPRRQPTEYYEGLVHQT